MKPKHVAKFKIKIPVQLIFCYNTIIAGKVFKVKSRNQKRVNATLANPVFIAISVIQRQTWIKLYITCNVVAIDAIQSDATIKCVILLLKLKNCIEIFIKIF